MSVIEGSCRLQSLYFPCHFPCNHQRSESRWIQAKNSEDLFQKCMVGIAATNPLQISVNTCSQQKCFVVATSNMTTSSRFHHHARNGLEGVGVGWDNFASFSSFEVAGFGPMQISTSVWTLARIAEVLWPCFFGANLSY